MEASSSSLQLVNTPFPSQSQLNGNDERALLSKYDFRPTSSRRLAGLKDLLLAAAAVVPYLVLRATRYMFMVLGVNEHKWRGSPNEVPLTELDKERLLSVASTLVSGTFRQQYHQQTLLSSGKSDDAASTRIVSDVICILTGFQRTLAKFGIPLGEQAQLDVDVKLARKLRTIAELPRINHQDVLKTLRKVCKKACKAACLAASSTTTLPHHKVVVKDYMLQCLMQLSNTYPDILIKAVDVLDDGSEIQEWCSMVPHTIGTEYLKLMGSRYEPQVAFMTEFPNTRPSDVKKEPEAQGMTINARLHRLTIRRPDGRYNEAYSCARSGAFAVHGRRPKGVGLAGLMRLQVQVREAGEEGQRALLSKHGFTSPSDLDAEVEYRTPLVLAQALPMVLAGLQQACGWVSALIGAHNSGAFLHVQQGLLSDLHRTERMYLQDMQAALAILSERLVIRFSFQPSQQLEVVEGSNAIILHLNHDLVPATAFDPPDGVACSRQEFLSRSYRYRGLLFNQGVNVLQSLGFLWCGDQATIPQDTINRQSLEALNDWALAAQKSGCGALAALNQHYSATGGARRAPKDVDAIWLVRRACNELGAPRGVCCKSGKDRTALELAISFAQEAVQRGMLRPSRQTALTAALQAGLSHQVTGQNHGQPDAYAFNEMELLTLPQGWRPLWRLCGKVMS